MKKQSIVGISILVVLIILVFFINTLIAANIKETTLKNEVIEALLNKDVKITFNNDAQEFYDEQGNRVYPISFEGTTYLPVRAMSSIFHIGISWDGINNSILLESNGSDGNYAKATNDFQKQGTSSIRAILNKQIKTYYDNQLQTFKNVKEEVVYPISYQDTTYLPVRALSNLFQIKIDWDGENNTVILSSKTLVTDGEKVDDWEYDPNSMELDYYGSTAGSASNGFSIKTLAPAVTMDAAVSNNIGFSTGGAKDANNFRENIKNGYFPISTDITYNGLFYDYSFDTGNQTESEELFSPSYSSAVSKDPISQNQEYYMTVGLNSNIKDSDFQRKKLNLVVVLDVSGSMTSGFNSYYYDSVFNPTEEKEVENKSKMQIANESVNVLLDQLKEDDRFGMVLFDNRAYLGKPLRLVSETNMQAIQKHILEIRAMGGTNFEAGYTEATKLFEPYKGKDADEYENRMIVITDAMPNYGTTSKEGLLSYVEKNSQEGIYTTFIGVGVDFNTELIEQISDVKGANYYSVHSSSAFKERMGEQFEYMVTPLVFDLKLDLQSKDYEIVSVYGSDTKDSKSGNIMKVNTLFPSKTSSNGEVKGGVILLKLKKLNENKDGQIHLKVSYQDRNGKAYQNEQTVTFDASKEHYDNTGIRKAIVLVRYANALKNWILYERSENPRFIITPVIGIRDCNLLKPEVIQILGENERTSVKLSVSDTYKEVFKKLLEYIKSESELLKDDTFKEELEIVNILVK